MTLGDEIRAFRNDKGMTLAQLARVLDVSLYTVHRWEISKSHPSPLSLLSLKRAGFTPSTEENLGIYARFTGR